MVTVSVVVPLYRCAGNVAPLARRLHAVLQRQQVSHEVLLVDDGSPDDEWNAILKCVKTYPEMIGISLHHNVGQQKAIAIGLSKASGTWTIVMDGDLQDRPEDIPKLLAAAKKQHGVVIARRTFRHISLFYLLLSRSYHLIISLISKKTSDASLGNFTVLDAKTRINLQKTSLVCLSYLQAVRRVASAVYFVNVVHDERASGKSSYTLLRLVKLAFVTFFCWIKPIRYTRRLISYDSLIRKVEQKAKVKRVLIIGVNGFLGSTLAKACIIQGMSVDGVYNTHRSSIPTGCHAYPLSFLCHLRDIYDTVFLVAAAIPYPGRLIRDDELVRTNIQLAHQVAIQFKNSFLVFSSSVAVCRNPPDRYGLTKQVAESLLLGCHKNTTIFRFSSLYGPGMYKGTFLPRIIDDAKKNKMITLCGDGTRKQDYLHVSDAAALLLAAARKRKFGTYLGVSGMSYTNAYIASIVCSRINGCRIRHRGVDRSPSYSYDATYTNKQFGFVPKMSLEQGITSML